MAARLGGVRAGRARAGRELRRVAGGGRDAGRGLVDERPQVGAEVGAVRRPRLAGRQRGIDSACRGAQPEVIRAT